MSHFAKVENGIVTNVIVIEQDVLNTGHWGDPSLWVQTSYNTYAGQHRLGGTPMRKNYAGIGHTYDSVRDAFYAPQPFPSWILNEDTCNWAPPIAMPESVAGTFYSWNEDNLSWDSVVYPVISANTSTTNEA